MCKNYSTTRMTIHLCLSLSLARRPPKLGWSSWAFNPAVQSIMNLWVLWTKYRNVQNVHNGLRVLGTRTEHGRVICVCTWPNCPWYICLGPHRLITDTILWRWSPMMSLVRLYRLQIHHLHVENSNLRICCQLKTRHLSSQKLGTHFGNARCRLKNLNKHEVFTLLKVGIWIDMCTLIVLLSCLVQIMMILGPFSEKETEPWKPNALCPGFREKMHRSESFTELCGRLKFVPLQLCIFVIRLGEAGNDIQRSI